jgi:peptide/nickel transport system substrate-binding protein/oligopeptide transport system substrate-binding protein
MLILMAMLLVACGGSSGSSGVTPTAAPKAPASQQVFRMALPVSDLGTFDPAQVSSLYDSQAIAAVFTGLVELNNKLEVTPQLASSYTHSSDNLTWTFTLKPNLKFSDGTSLTSADVVYSIDRALSPEISSLNGVSLTYLGLIKDSEKRVNGKIHTLIGDSLMAPDPNTVVIKLNQPGGYFLQALTYPTSWVVEKKVIQQWGLKWTDHLSDNGGQGGAGAFIVTKYDHTTGITYAPNPNYYGSKPQLTTMNFVFIKEVKTTYETFQAGQIDDTGSEGVPAANYDQAKTMPGFVNTPTLSIAYYAMNFLVKPFDNIHIREAFSMAVNRDIITQAIYKGLYVPTCHIVPQGMPGFSSNLTCPGGVSTSGDANKAKQLFQQGLQEEGLTLATFPTVTITYASGSTARDNQITTARQMWKTALGIDVKGAAIDFNQLVTQVNNSPNNPKGLQMWAIGWIADYPDPQDWTSLQFAKGSPNNNVNYGQNNTTNATQQQQTQQLLAQADVTADQTQRLQMYNQAEQQLVNDVSWMSIFQQSTPRLVKTYVIGRTFNAFDIVPPDAWASVYIAQH